MSLRSSTAPRSSQGIAHSIHCVAAVVGSPTCCRIGLDAVSHVLCQQHGLGTLVSFEFGNQNPTLQSSQAEQPYGQDEKRDQHFNQAEATLPASIRHNQHPPTLVFARPSRLTVTQRFLLLSVAAVSSKLALPEIRPEGRKTREAVEPAETVAPAARRSRCTAALSAGAAAVTISQPLLQVSPVAGRKVTLVLRFTASARA
ncbi:hypothetical protein SAMN05216201_10795 [Pseudomonas linyingensis]|uniref:Uncharacterized protein n=1 Tax=Pseudomonas linyingensis TaxID=915471 RepID=A0A1H6Y999_9PSED|nr:hypothetical protein SAMN05216201_10795 [Pseudomonas linyingensis]